jgi:surface antigen
MRKLATAVLAAALSSAAFAAHAEADASSASVPSAISAPVPSSIGAALPSMPQLKLPDFASFKNWQCVTFARAFSGLQIFGDAWTWWEKASGKYVRGFQPESKAVLVFKPKGSMSRGHVAVVEQVLTDRVIQITHANWSPIGGRRGQVESDVTVVDVSDSNDWSQVKVWYGPMKDLGGTVYPTYGFIYQPGADREAGMQKASWSGGGSTSADVLR